jgi:hypothetical protein
LIHIFFTIVFIVETLVTAVAFESLCPVVECIHVLGTCVLGHEDAVATFTLDHSARDLGSSVVDGNVGGYKCGEFKCGVR